MKNQSTWITEVGKDGLVFSDRLKDLIVASGKTARQVSHDTGISESSLSMYQKDGCSRAPDSNTFRTLAQYFGCSYEYLYGDVAASKLGNLEISKKLGLSDKAIDLLRAMNPDKPSQVDNEETEQTDSLLRSVSALFNRMVDIGFFDLLLDIELFNQEVDRISKDSIPSEEMEISQLVGNWNKDRPSGTAILPQHEYYKYKVQEFERAFGNILKTIIAAPGG